MVTLRDSLPIQPQEQQLDEILTSYLKAVDAGCPPDQQQLLNLYPDLAAELREFFHNQERFDCLAGPLRSLVVGAPVEPVRTPILAEPTLSAESTRRMVDSSIKRFGGFELLEEIGQGGMGVVYKARQISLNRVVALKMIRADAYSSQEALARFRREAQAAASLQHPHVVQIFTVGKLDGYPYIALEYVEGKSLAQLLDGTPLPALQAARLVEILARTVHYAHAEGIIHRDLKPANILLQARSLQAAALETVKITDFGLAKYLERDHTHLTETGIIVGTPSYMAPEQAKGKSDQAGPGTDIYALGVLLYELLTGRPPFRGVSHLDTLQQVVEDDPVPPHQLQPRVPRDLETICLKCLQKDARQRYATGLAVAEELKRFQAGEPILSRKTGSGDRAWRWCKRNPLPAVLWMALLFTLLGGVILVGLFWLRAEANLRTANKHLEEATRQKAAAEREKREAERQRIDAEENFDLAHQAVKKLGMQMSEKELSPLPGSQAVRQVILDATLLYYETFLKKRNQDPTLRTEVADVYFRAARITNAIGSKDKALKHYAMALGYYEELQREEPAKLAIQTEMAHTHNNMGIIHDNLGDRAAALKSFQKARDLHENVLKERPSDPIVKDALASTYNNLATLHARGGQTAEALEAYRHVIPFREQLVRDVRNEPEYQSGLANCYENLGVLYGRIGTTAQVLEVYDKALAIREQIARKYPNNIKYQRELAQSYRYIGDRLRLNGEPVRGFDHLNKGHEILVKLANANPQVTYLKCDLAGSHSNFGIALRQNGQLDRAIEAHGRAQRILEELVREHPGVAQYKCELGKTYFNLGLAHVVGKKAGDGLNWYDQAYRLQIELVQTHPETPDCFSDLALTLNNRGVVWMDLGRHDDARKALREAIKYQGQALEKAPQVIQYRSALINHLAALANLERHVGQADAAVKLTLERQKLSPTNPDELYHTGRELALAAAVVGKDKAVLAAQEKADQRKYADLAMDALRRAVAHGFQDRERLVKDPGLHMLRERGDFKELSSKLASVKAGNE